MKVAEHCPVPIVTAVVLASGKEIVVASTMVGENDAFQNDGVNPENVTCAYVVKRCGLAKTTVATLAAIVAETIVGSVPPSVSGRSVPIISVVYAASGQGPSKIEVWSNIEKYNGTPAPVELG